MYISDLIKKLQEAEKAYGNNEIFITDSFGVIRDPLIKLGYRAKTKDGKDGSKKFKAKDGVAKRGSTILFIQSKPKDKVDNTPY